jgi:hypothetical protein
MVMVMGRRFALAIASLLLLVGCSTNSSPVSDAAANDQIALPEASADQRPSPDLPASISGTISGVVVSKGKPVSGAVVCFGGQIESALSDENGRFALTVSEPVDGRIIALTAGKEGYFTGYVEVYDPSASQRIEIEALGFKDEPNYVFKSPDESDAAPHCLHCHRRQVTPWRASAHASAALNPKLHDMYNGTASGLKGEASCVAAGGRWLAGQAFGRSTAQHKCYVAGGNVLATMNPGLCGGVGQPSCDDPGAPAANKPRARAPTVMRRRSPISSRARPTSTRCARRGSIAASTATFATRSSAST